MSGGSYNYLCYATLSDRQGDLEAMFGRLNELANEHAGEPSGIGYRRAARATKRILDTLEVPDGLSRIWKAVEWRDSCDWGEDQMDEEAVEVMNMLPDPRPVVTITTGVLDALQTGRHDLETVTRARAVLEASGCRVQSHALEEREIAGLKERAAALLRQAKLLEGTL